MPTGKGQQQPLNLNVTLALDGIHIQSVYFSGLYRLTYGLSLRMSVVVPIAIAQIPSLVCLAVDKARAVISMILGEYRIAANR